MKFALLICVATMLMLSCAKTRESWCADAVELKQAISDLNTEILDTRSELKSIAYRTDLEAIQQRELLLASIESAMALRDLRLKDQEQAEANCHAEHPQQVYQH